jgi:acyl-CoA synthetase (NDP forming)
MGRLPVEFLLRHGFGGRVYPVRRDGATVLGLASYPSVSACPEPVDLAMIMVAADRVVSAVEDCAAAAVPVAIVAASGFAETGPAGAGLQRRLLDAARAGGVRLLGPNCIGTVGVANRQVTSFSPLFSGERTELVEGNLGFVSQSGALGYGAVSLAFQRGLGLGWVVTTGNEADVTALEAIAAVAAEPGCAGILGYVETLRDAEQLRAAAGSGVPVAILKAGRSEAGARAAASHTGALAAGDRVVDAALRQLGVVRVDDVDELLDVGDAFAQPRRPDGPRVAVVTTSGGSGILAADAVEKTGLTLAGLSPATTTALEQIVPAYGSTANPVDVTASVMSRPELFDQALRLLVEDSGVDAVVACFCVLTGDDVQSVVTSLSRCAERSGKPVLVARTGADHLAPRAAAELRAAGIPAYPTPARAVRAAAALHQVTTPSPVRRQVCGSLDASREGGGAAARERGGGSNIDASREGNGGGSNIDASRQGGATPHPGIGEAALKVLLGGAGLPVPRGRLASDRDDAAAAVAELGGRAVLKAVVPGLTHKTEAGGVVLDMTPGQAAEVFDRLAVLGGDVLVEESVTGGVEALVGVTASPLGPVLTVGPGGVLTELMDDVALRLLPVDAEEVESMLDETRLGALLAGMRGAAPADRAGLADTVLAVARLVASWPAGFELDLNPVAVLPDGVRILDATYVAPAGTG